MAEEAKLVIEIREEGQPGAPAAPPTGSGAPPAGVVAEAAAGTPGGPLAPAPVRPVTMPPAGGEAPVMARPVVPAATPPRPAEGPPPPAPRPLPRVTDEELRARQAPGMVATTRDREPSVADRAAAFLPSRFPEGSAARMIDVGGRPLLSSAATAVRAGGSFASSVVRGDNLGGAVGLLHDSVGTIGRVADQAAAGLSRLGPQGQAAAAGLELAGANVRAELQSFRDDLREAQVLGPDMARLTDAQSKFNHELREALLPIKQALIELLIPLLKMLMPLLRNILAQLLIFARAMEKLSDILPFGGGKDMKKMWHEMAEALRKAIAGGMVEANRELLMLDDQLNDLGIGRRILRWRDWDVPGARPAPPPPPGPGGPLFNL